MKKRRYKRIPKGKLKRKLPKDARCEICNHMQIVDGFCSCWRGNHMQDGFFRYKNPTDVCGNFSRNIWIKDEEKA